MHIHLGFVDFLKVWCYYLIGAWLWQTIAARLAHTSFGRGMAYFL